MLISLDLLLKKRSTLAHKWRHFKEKITSRTYFWPFLICCICQCYRVFSVARIVNKALRSVFGCVSWLRAEKKFFRPLHTFRSPSALKVSPGSFYPSPSSSYHHRSLNFPITSPSPINWTNEWIIAARRKTIERKSLLLFCNRRPRKCLCCASGIYF